MREEVQADRWGNGVCNHAGRRIAIIGMSCRFAGASNPQELWSNLASGNDVWSKVPQNRFDANSLYHPNQERTDRHHLRGGYFVDGDPMAFDAAFFSCSTEAARSMDPQLRVSMEGVYEAIEDAGIPLDQLAGSNTSVFSGTFGRDYSDRLIKDPETLPPSFFVGNGAAMYSNRISHFFDLKGPSVTTDTGCSGSMAALHLAAQTIWQGESDMSIVTVAQYMLNHDLIVALSNLGVLGPDGRCYSWDHRAQGYGRGEGMAAVVLKRLDKALIDGDHIYSVILETAMNQDGKTSTLTSPSVDAQVDLITKCYSRAGLDMSSTPYIEAHMTGTPTGDPIEAEALARTFGASRTDGNPVYVGSIKPNIGHTEPVSGLASLLKTVLVLQNRQIPPHLNFEKPNPSILLDKWNLQLPMSLTQWPEGKPLRASINNFGYGGTNVHIILEGAPNLLMSPKTCTTGTMTPQPNHNYVFLVSSRHHEGSIQASKNLATYISNKSLRMGKELRLHDLAYTLAQRRSRHNWTVTVSVSSLNELVERLQDSQLAPSRAPADRPSIGFIFTGQGAQWNCMGRELVARYPVFAASLREASQILQDKFGASFVLYDELMRDEGSSRIHQAHISQPVTVVLQLCLVNLLNSWHVEPSAVVSHSSGEISAAYASGVLSFEEAIGTVYNRGLLASSHVDNDGGMMAVKLGAAETEDYLAEITTGKAVVACVNSPTSTTLSGDNQALDEVAKSFENDGVSFKRLNVPLAYHSHHMHVFANDYRKELDRLLGARSRSSKIPFASPTTGRLSTPGEATFGPGHWVQNLVNPVLFSDALQAMTTGSNNESEAKLDILIELGPHSTLSGAVRETLGRKSPAYFSCLRRSTNAVLTMQQLACGLVTKGYPVSLSEVNSAPDVVPKYVPELPSYVWDHSNTYVEESRASHENRYRKSPPHELLGSPVPGIIGRTATWRSFLRLHDLPWLADHQLESQVVFPAAGYVSMAIEAVRRSALSAKNDRAPSHYHLREVEVLHALVIPGDSVGAEVALTLRECDEKELDHKDWYAFEVCSVSRQGTWTQHCRGFVMAERADSVVSTEQRGSLSWDQGQPQESNAPVQEREKLDVESMFATMRETGIYHGPAFQNLIASGRLGLSSFTSFKLGTVAADTKHDYIVHPTSLDSIFQTCYFSIPAEVKSGGMTVPRSIGSISVSARCQQEHVLQSSMRLDTKFRNGVILHGTVSHACTPSDLVLKIDAFRLQRISTADSTTLRSGLRIHSHCRWEMDVLHHLSDRMKESMSIKLSEADVSYERELQESAYHLMVRALDDLRHSDRRYWLRHHQKYYEWMQNVVDSIHQGNSPFAAELGCKTWSSRSYVAKTNLLDVVSTRDPGGELLYKIGSQLGQILRGNVTPLELMMENGLLHQYYAMLPQFVYSYKHLRKLVELYSVKVPGSRVLEIGAGTGGATVAVLDAFASRADEESSGTLLGHYHFTDVSADFFTAAKEKFRHMASKMTFQKLDIEHDPSAQGFVNGAYDLIIASQVLHATKNLCGTLANVRKLLKPTGKLMLVEATRHRYDQEVIFGTLPGWWLSEEPERQSGAIADTPTWDAALKSSGFSGVDYDLEPCAPPEAQACSVLMASAVHTPSYPFSTAVIHDSCAPDWWLEKLMQMVKARTGSTSTRSTLENMEVQDDTVYLVTLEMDQSLIDTMNEAKFGKIRTLFANSKGTLWISRGAGVSNEIPLRAVMQGVTRTLRREDHSKRHVLLDLDFNQEAWTGSNIDSIMQVMEQTFDYVKDGEDMDYEYAVHDCILHVPRLYPARNLDIECSGVQGTAVPKPWAEAGRELTYQIPVNSTGFVDKIIFEETKPSTREAAVPHGMVEIEPVGFGMNFQDVAIALGLVDNLNAPTHELAGIVKRLGPGCEESGLQVGDHVCGAARGTFGSISRAWWHNIIKMPDAMSFDEGAAFSIVYLTAYVGLVHSARLEAGEKVLIHSAAGGVGQAAVMLAKSIGAEVYVTCGTSEKRKLLRDRYHIPEDRIFSSRNSAFAAGIKAQTGGRGVDVVLNSLAGPLLKASWECVAAFGRFVEIGKVDLQAARRLNMAPFARNITMAGIDLVQYSEQRGAVIQNTLKELVRLYSNGAIRSVFPVVSYPISRMQEAFQDMQAGAHAGKLVVIAQPQENVNVLARPPKVDFPSMHMTHVVVGGLTGIGYRIACWMIDQGAKHLLALSRDAESHVNAECLRDVARTHGCELMIRSCDVADEQSLLDAIAAVGKQGFPPIGGVVQGAMVLDDSVWERMTFAQWQRAVRPKIQGTVNLHNHLHHLAYFVMLSSGTAITGNVSQANYAAGNAVQDSLARHRVANGKPALSINLGPVADVGFFAEAVEKGQQLVTNAVTSIVLSVDSLLKLVERGITQSLSATVDESQIITCFPSHDHLPKDDKIVHDTRLGTLRLGDTNREVERVDDGSGESHVSGILQQLVSRGQSLPEVEAAQLVLRLLVAEIAELFGISPDEIDEDSSLTDLGIDSLVAVRFRNWLGNCVKARFTVFEILQASSLREFTRQVAARSGLVK